MIERISGAPLAPALTPSAAPTAPGFGDKLGAALDRIDAQEQRADSALELLASGQSADLHGTMIELEKADIALRTMVSVRDRLIGAYEQVMNMAI